MTVVNFKLLQGLRVYQDISLYDCNCGLSRLGLRFPASARININNPFNSKIAHYGVKVRLKSESLSLLLFYVIVESGVTRESSNFVQQHDDKTLIKIRTVTFVRLLCWVCFQYYKSQTSGFLNLKFTSQLCRSLVC